MKQKHIDLWFIDSYLELCRDIKHFNIMLKKHRIKYNSNDIVSLNKFSDMLLNIRSNNNYIKEKPGFDFVGGRMAQRAYYDMLRDLAHLSPKNSHLKQIIRFSKYEIERKFQNKFQKLSDEEIKDFIEKD